LLLLKGTISSTILYLTDLNHNKTDEPDGKKLRGFSGLMHSKLESHKARWLSAAFGKTDAASQRGPYEHR